MRGLKLIWSSSNRISLVVAPFAGAWIEIPYINEWNLSSFMSHPSRVRGLKFVAMQAVENDVAVAPFAGAWIEIFVAGASFSHALVAPFAGAWIEILTSALKPGLVETSHPSRVRGLKSFTMDACRPSTIVAPFAGAWIEIARACLFNSTSSRRTLRGCVD